MTLSHSWPFLLGREYHRRRRASFPLPQSAFNRLVARSTGGGFRGRATETERKRAAAVASTSDQKAIEE